MIHLDDLAHAVRLDEGQVRLSLGAEIYSGDVIETGPRDHMTILFSDGSELALANNTRFSLDSFAFNRPKRISHLDAWVLDGSFVFTCGMMSNGGAAVFQVGMSKVHLASGSIAGKIKPAERASMFTLLADDEGYVGNASLMCRDNAILLGGKNDTSVISEDTGKASKVFKLSDGDLAESYKGLFVGAWHDKALDKMNPANQEKPEKPTSRLRTTDADNSKKTA